jgi:hypothetical protein
MKKVDAFWSWMEQRKTINKQMKLRFYTKPECPLCDEVREVLEAEDCDWDEVNIFTDPQLIEKFRNEIPVIESKNGFWFYRDKDKIPLQKWLISAV